MPIDAQQPREIPAGVEVIGCPLALLGSVTPEYRAGAVPPVRYRQGAEEVSIVWPPGFSARLNPTLEIVAPDGAVLGREGQPTEELGGGYGNDDRFGVCLPHYGPRRLP